MCKSRRVSECTRWVGEVGRKSKKTVFIFREKTLMRKLEWESCSSSQIWCERTLNGTKRRRRSLKRCFNNFSMLCLFLCSWNRHHERANGTLTKLNNSSSSRPSAENVLRLRLRLCDFLRVSRHRQLPTFSASRNSRKTRHERVSCVFCAMEKLV